MVATMNGTRWYDVAAGHSASPCSGSTCKTQVYWIRDGGRSIPVDCSVEGGIMPSETADDSQIDLLSSEPPVIRDGRGLHHMTVCENADEIRQRMAAR